MKSPIHVVVIAALACAAGCASTRVPCETHLVPINPPPLAALPRASAPGITEAQTGPKGHP